MLIFVQKVEHLSCAYSNGIAIYHMPALAYFHGISHTMALILVWHAFDIWFHTFRCCFRCYPLQIGNTFFHPLKLIFRWWNSQFNLAPCPNHSFHSVLFNWIELKMRVLLCFDFLANIEFFNFNQVHRAGGLYSLYTRHFNFFSKSKFSKTISSHIPTYLLVTELWWNFVSSFNYVKMIYPWIIELD